MSDKGIVECYTRRSKFFNFFGYRKWLFEAAQLADKTFGVQFGLNKMNATANGYSCKSIMDQDCENAKTNILSRIPG